MAKIVIIDSGIDLTNREFEGRKISGIHIYEDKAGHINIDENIKDQIGHGTAVAAILNEDLDNELFVIKIFDEEMECNVKEVLELYSDLLDELAEIEKTESPQLASEEILQRLFFSIVRNSQFLANVLTKLYNAVPHKEQSFADKLGAALSSIQASSYILGACARGTSPERLKKVIQDLQKHSTF